MKFGRPQYLIVVNTLEMALIEQLSALNKVLDRCHGVQFGGRMIPGAVTREMTPYELKFALLGVTEINNFINLPSINMILLIWDE